MKRKLDIETWNRKEHFNFFKQFDEPFFGLTVEVDCTKAYHYCKKEQVSFFLYYLYLSLKVANSIDAFKYRIIGGEVYVYDKVHASPTINRANGTFGFSYINYDPSFTQFIAKAEIEMKRVKRSNGLKPAVSGENVIHYSSLPWINFKSLSHARHFSFEDSSPKITFGKMIETDGKRIMPVSIHVHHALMDGYDVSTFIDEFQRLKDEQ